MTTAFVDQFHTHNTWEFRETQWDSRIKMKDSQEDSNKTYAWLIYLLETQPITPRAYFWCPFDSIDDFISLLEILDLILTPRIEF